LGFNFLVNRWIHDYQEACVEKLERFLRGERGDKRSGLRSLGSSFEDNPPHGPPHGYGESSTRSKRGHLQGLGASFEECL